MIDPNLQKQKICATVSPVVKARVTKGWKETGYASASDLINTALIEFFARQDLKAELGIRTQSPCNNHDQSALPTSHPRQA